MSKKIIAGLGISAALGVAVLPAGVFAANTATTYIKATVNSIVACESTNNTADTAVNIAEIVAGEAKTGTFTISGSTNNPNGFTVTGTPYALGHKTIAGESIAYSSSAVAAGTQGWNIVDEGAAGVTIGNTIALNSALVTDGARQTSWTLTANVSTATTTTVGEYNGTIAWTCAVN